MSRVKASRAPESKLPRVYRAEHTTYVAQQNLEPSDDPSPITHPQLDSVFATFFNGRYYQENLN